MNPTQINIVNIFTFRWQSDMHWSPLYTVAQGAVPTFPLFTNKDLLYYQLFNNSLHDLMITIPNGVKSNA